MQREFRLPDLGEGVAEAEIDRWLVKEGDIVAEDDLLVEVVTDKATAEIPSPFAGVVTRIHVEAGRSVPVGTALVTIADPDSASERSVAAESIKATPPVRRLARDLDVDLARVTGTGAGGRITRADVEALAAASARQGKEVAEALPESERAPAAEALPGPDGIVDAPPEVDEGVAVQDTAPHERRERLHGVRRIIAERMAQSHTSIPAVTHVEECDVTELAATRRAYNERTPGTKLTLLPFIVKACVSALKQYPALNASLDEDAGELVFHHRYDIGVAVDTPAGLVVPTIRGAGTKPLADIAGEIERLAASARAGKLSAQELRGSTFTITSPGRFGGLMATPIIFHPQTGILGVHRADERPVVRNGQIVVRTMMNLSITFDHRVLDGLTAAKFCLEIVRLLEHPALLALE